MARRAVVNGPGKPLKLENCEIPDAPQGKIRIRIAYSGICHSDLHVKEDANCNLRSFFGEENYKKIVPGHEISGYVDDVASDVDGSKYPLQKGDKVIVYACVGCQECLVCQKGHNNICADEKALLYTIGKNPNRPGGYQTHIVVDPKYAFKVPENVPLEIACLLTCSGGTAYSAVSMLRDAVKFGLETSESSKARILIIGVGGLGTWAIRISRALYGDSIHIIATEIDQNKLTVARTAGADEVILWSSANTDEHNASLVTNSGPIHGAVDFVGTSRTVFSGVQCLTKNGAMVLVGLENGEINLPVRLMVVKQINLRGCLVFGIDQLKSLLNLVAEKNIAYPDITTFSLDEVNTALELLEKGHITGRAVLKQE